MDVMKNVPRAQAAKVCGKSKASSVNPVRAPSAKAINLTGMLITRGFPEWFSFHVTPCV